MISDLDEIAALKAVPKRARVFAARPPWWSREVAIAQAQSRRARRRYSNSAAEWGAMQDAEGNEKRVTSEAARKSWRESAEEASKKPTSFWALERWARLRSGLPPQPLHLPELIDGERPENVARTFGERPGY